MLPGIMMSSHSPPVSTPLEPCRVAPYVNMPSSMRGSNVSTTASQHFQSSSAAAAAAFSAFDPALLSAAHQVFVYYFPFTNRRSKLTLLNFSTQLLWATTTVTLEFFQCLNIRWVWQHSLPPTTKTLASQTYD